MLGTPDSHSWFFVLFKIFRDYSYFFVIFVIWRIGRFVVKRMGVNKYTSVQTFGSSAGKIEKHCPRKRLHSLLFVILMIFCNSWEIYIFVLIRNFSRTFVAQNRGNPCTKSPKLCHDKTGEIDRKKLIGNTFAAFGMYTKGTWASIGPHQAAHFPIGFSISRGRLSWSTDRTSVVRSNHHYLKQQFIFHMLSQWRTLYVCL